MAPVPDAAAFPLFIHASATQLVSTCSLGICTWDTTTGKLVGSVAGSAWAISPDHRLLAVAGKRGTISIVDAPSGRSLQTLAGHPVEQAEDAGTNITCLAFGPDGHTLISAAANDPSVKVWAIPDGTLSATLQVPAGSVTNVSFSADGTRLATAGLDLATQIWDLPTHHLVSTAPSGHGVSAVALSPDGTRVAQARADAPLTVFDANTFTLVATAITDGEATMPTFSADGDALAYSLYDKHQIAVWHLKDNRAVVIDTQKPAAPAFGPNSDVVYSATEYSQGSPQQVRSWNTRSGAAQLRFESTR